ncbi:hypothetical protein BU26DRAFT_507270 [Trematosphaeria pertusa]|uniref:Uncharacterized protein n=1 Tax=Trematosphaeria pertusa TaxID=390896 RepID=A0A6A6I925_9PLEO|nr:uncharacterized protein BU26DRAFT_507270 [Trematosphaeria pertusa]KAF2246719.1 hypothetical protein BU26DRAFT_507270 [Trematosphaeria pertusa]
MGRSPASAPLSHRCATLPSVLTFSIPSRPIARRLAFALHRTAALSQLLCSLAAPFGVRSSRRLTASAAKSLHLSTGRSTPSLETLPHTSAWRPTSTPSPRHRTAPIAAVIALALAAARPRSAASSRSKRSHPALLLRARPPTPDLRRHGVGMLL